MSDAPRDVAVPLLDLRLQYAALKESLDAAIERVVSSQHFVLGPEVDGLEVEIAAYTGAAHAVGVGSGSDALEMALVGLGVGPGDEVVCPAFTFFSTAGTIARLGARPVFADIDPATFNVTVASLEAAAARCQNLTAILPVHLYGRALPLAELEALGARLGVPVIDDAAQALGAIDGEGVRVGAACKATTLSFFPTKNLGGFGEGGMVLTGDAELADRMRMLRVHGMAPKYHHPLVGMNARLDALQAAVLREKLPHLDSWHQARARNAAHYDALFGKAGALPGDSSLGAGLPLRLPLPVTAPARHIYNQYVVRVPAALRDPLRAHLAHHQIGSEIYYPVPLHLQECFAHLGHSEGELVHSEAASMETLALPIFPELTPEQRETVAARVVEFLGSAA